jgi:hypothetical protein
MDILYPVFKREEVHNVSLAKKNFLFTISSMTYLRETRSNILSGLTYVGFSELTKS